MGGKESISIDVRIIAATHRDLEAAIQERLFREDLFYRLNVVTITVPPLHERTEDTPDLARYFLRKYGPEVGVATPSITPEAIALLQQQKWPRNVRELENTVRQALLLAREYTISAEHVKEVQKPKTSRHEPAVACSLHYRSPRSCGTRRCRQCVHENARQPNQSRRVARVTRLKMREKLKEFGLRDKTAEDFNT